MSSSIANMDPDIRRRWVEAARSGEYTQAYDCLHAGDGKCCILGILVDIYLQEKGMSWDDVYEEYEDEWEESLPEGVREWAGLTSLDSDPLVFDKEKGIARPISCLNDVDHLPLNKIADFIEGKA